MSTITQTLTARELLQDISDPDQVNKLTDKESFYVGFDPTAPSFQVGNLVPLMGAVHIARCGPKPIILFGGATGAIGDPSGKSEERKLLSREVLDANIERQVHQATTLFSKIGVTPQFVNNYDWTFDMTVLDYLRDVGKYFTVNYMLQKETIKTRVEGDGISFTEFSYLTLQAMDYVHLYKEKHCRLQVGGSDQWGNITSGLELLRKKELHGASALSFPLVTNSAGKKFGKSEDGAIWLDADMTSPYKFHQFWLNQHDEDAVKYLKMFTLLELDEIAELEAKMKEAPQERAAQKRLADEVCSLVHSEEATADAKKSAEVLFGGSLEGLSDAHLEEIFSDVPSSTLSRSMLAEMTIVDLFAATDLAKSKGDARRLVSGGGAYLNNQRIEDIEQRAADSAQDSSLLVLRSGKKKYYLIKLAD